VLKKKEKPQRHKEYKGFKNRRIQEDELCVLCVFVVFLLSTQTAIFSIDELSYCASSGGIMSVDMPGIIRIESNFRRQ
jgi:hypothetical protein